MYTKAFYFWKFLKKDVTFTSLTAYIEDTLL